MNIWHTTENIHFHFVFPLTNIESKHSNASDFQLVYEDCMSFVSGYFNSTTNLTKNDGHFLEDTDYTLNYSPRPSISPRRSMTVVLDTINEEDEEEPPLLEELGIYPQQIRDNAMTLINPFAGDRLVIETFLANLDLSGPIFCAFIFGACLFLAGKVFIFSHLYALSMFSVFGMYGLLKLLCYDQHAHCISIKGVACALGYGLLHLIWLAFIGIFIRLNTFDGFIFATLAIVLSTAGASRILSIMSNQPNQRTLIAYPTAMIYILFSFLVAF